MEHQHKYNSGQIMEIRRFCDITTLQGDRKSWTAAIKPVKVDVFFASPLVVTADKKIWHVTVMIKSSARHLNNFYSLATYLGTLLTKTRQPILWELLWSTFGLEMMTN